MAHFKKSFPSRFTQASDFDDGPVTVTIKSPADEDFGTKDNPQTKPVMLFEEDLKPLVLNLTRKEADRVMAHFKWGFPSRFTQASDFDDGPVTVTIKSTADEDFGTKDNPQTKPVVLFEEDLKPVVLNLTHAEVISEIADSEDMDNWPGTRIQLSKGSTRFQGKKVACIDVSQPAMNSTLAEQAGS